MLLFLTAMKCSLQSGRILSLYMAPSHKNHWNIWANPEIQLLMTWGAGNQCCFFFYRKSIWQLFVWFYSLYIIDTRLYIIPYFMLYSNNKQPSDQLSLATNMGPPLPSDRWNQDGLLGVWVQGGRITQSQNVEHGFANWVPSDLEQILNGGYSRWYSISMREFGLI